MNPIQNTQKLPLALAKAQEYFKQEEINFPYISESDKSKLLSISQDIFGTYPQPPAPLYDLERYVKEALSNPREYVLFGNDGHGFESRGMHYYAVKKHVAIFVQVSAGVSQDPNLVHEKINAIFHGIALILESIEDAEKQNLIPDGQRLLIVNSDFYGNGWEWITGNPGEIDQAEWKTESPVLLSALMDIPSKESL
ncbi:MAG TPA: hypothetical protein VGP47_03520 [Parachlamydiaceae bacterium]|nr:hypothetical protein [Parachlamydiaceae bacterium]